MAKKKPQKKHFKFDPKSGQGYLRGSAKDNPPLPPEIEEALKAVADVKGQRGLEELYEDVVQERKYPPHGSLPGGGNAETGRGEEYYEGTHGGSPEGGYERGDMDQAYHGETAAGPHRPSETGRYGKNPLGWAETFRRRMSDKAKAWEFSAGRDVVAAKSAKGLKKLGLKARAMAKGPMGMAGQIDMMGRHPVAQGAMLAGLAAPALIGLSSKLRGRLDEMGDLRGTFEKRLGLAGEQRAAEQASLMRAERVANLMQMNLQRLASVAPDLYMQVAAGQRLPQGATVLGGKPRTDLLKQLAMQMSEGRFGGQDPDLERIGAGIGPGGQMGPAPDDTGHMM